MKRKKVIWMLLLMVSIILSACGGQQTGNKVQSEGVAKDFPNKPIRMIVPFAPGGGTDVVARILSEKISKYLPNEQVVVVENKEGGGGTIGTTELINAKPDGYTIGLLSSGPVSIQPHFGNTSYTATDPTAIMRTYSIPHVLLVKADAPWKTYEEWLDYVKENPGKFTYSTSGTGTAAHLAMEAVNQAAGIQTKHIPFDGTSLAITGLLGGHVQGAIVEGRSFSNTGDLRALFSTGETDTYPDVTILKDKGIDVEKSVFTGVFGPKDMPTEIREVLHDAYKKALEDPAVIEAFKKQGVETAYASQEEFTNIIKEDFDENGVLLKSAELIK